MGCDTPLGIRIYLLACPKTGGSISMWINLYAYLI